MSDYTVVKTQVECYKFRHPSGMYWADITIDAQKEKEGGRIQIASDYGSWQNYWGAPGSSFKEFLSKLDMHYVAGKFGVSSQFDEQATIAAYKATAQQYKSDRAFYKEVTKEIKHIEDNCSHKEDFIVELQSCRKIMYMFDGCPELCTCIDTGFLRFWENVWPIFIEHIKLEISAPNPERSVATVAPSE